MENERTVGREDLLECLGLVEGTHAANGRSLCRDLDGTWWMVEEHGSSRWLMTTCDEWR